MLLSGFSLASPLLLVAPRGYLPGPNVTPAVGAAYSTDGAYGLKHNQN